MTVSATDRDNGKRYHDRDHSSGRKRYKTSSQERHRDRDDRSSHRVTSTKHKRRDFSSSDSSSRERERNDERRHKHHRKSDKCKSIKERNVSPLGSDRQSPQHSKSSEVHFPHRSTSYKDERRDRGDDRRRRHSSSDDSDRSHSPHHRSSERKRQSSSHRRKHRHYIKAEKYDGSSCVESYLMQFSSIAAYNEWDSADRAAHLRASLTGAAAHLFWQTPDVTYDEIIDKLRSRFGTKEQQEQHRIELKYRRRGEGETLQELSQDIEKLVALAYPATDHDTRDILARDAFIDSLDRPSLIMKLKEKEPHNLRSALTLAMKFEVLHMSMAEQKANQKPRQIRATQAGDKEEKVKSQYHVDSLSQQPRRNIVNKDNRLNRSVQPKRQEEMPQQQSQPQQSSHLSTTPAWRKDMDSLRQHVDQSVDRLASMIRDTVSLHVAPSSSPHPLFSTTSLTATQLPELSVNSQQWRHNAPRQSPSYTTTPTQQSGYQMPHSTDSNGRQTRPAPRCFNCGELGHIRKYCPYEQRVNAGGWSNNPTPAAARGVSERCGSSPVYIRTRIGNRFYRCLLDSGCDMTLLPSNLVKKDQIYSTTQSCLAANGTKIPVLGWSSIEATIGSVPVEISGLVSEHIVEIMLGVDWLRRNGVIWDFAHGRIQLNDEVHDLEFRKKGQGWCRRVILVDSVTVPPRSQLDVCTKVVFNDLNLDYSQSEPPRNMEQESASAWGTEPHEIKNGILVARALLPNRAENLPVRIMNVTDEPVGLNKDTVVGSLEPLQPLPPPSPQPSLNEPAEYGAIVDDMMSKVDSSVPDDIRVKLKELLLRYPTVFSKDEWDLGWTDLVTHKIDIGDNKPFRQRMRWYPKPHLEAIDSHVDTMLKQGVIEPCVSEFASNVVLAKKKDGTLRCCIDFRQLNDLTRKDAYPLPSTAQSLDALGGSKWFTTVDLRSGYHQLAMHPPDADKTAFITRRGVFKFRTMPFGLCNAVATFQRLMDLCLSGLNLDICLVYLDDVVVFSATPEQHLERLELVLQRLCAANLKLKPSKCSLMQTKITFLGHIISAEGIATDPEKTRLIAEWPAPTNLKLLRGFLGLAGYYRKFVEGFSRKAAPLNNLLKKNRSFNWTSECQTAFEELKLALTTPPVLALPDEHGTFILDTDACETSIGAVLSQMQNGQEKVVAYAGRTLSTNEVNYCITRKELLAIVYFAKYFRQYLLGRDFIARTDHAAISWLRKLNRPVGQNARWLEQLEEYSFVVQHRRGASHSNADALSRHPCINRPSCTACHPRRTIFAIVDFTGETQHRINSVEVGTADQSSSVPTSTRPNQSDESLEPSTNVQLSGNDSVGWSSDEIAAAQRNDSNIRPIIELLAAHEVKPDWKFVEMQSAEVKSLWTEWPRLSMKNGILCRRWTPLYGQIESWQIVLPRVYRKDFIRMTHTGMTGGHLGRAKTEDQVRRRVYWPNWRHDVTSEVKRCVECAQYHRGKAPRQTLLQPFGAGEPFEIVAIDITGKHPKSARGNEYIVTMTCIFSKWSEAYPVRNHTAPVVARVLVDNWISRYGVPLRLLSDLGVEFESQLFQELCRWMNIDKIRTTAYKPSTNGCIERFHRTLNSMLGKVVQTNQRDWDDRLASVMAAYRASKHASTGQSPNMIIFGKENRAPIDIALGPVQGEEQHYESYDEYVERLQGRLRESHRLAREHLGVAAERRKHDYDAKVKDIKFTPGQWVWRFYPRRYSNRSPKWSRPYDGPYLITKIIEPCDYVIQRSKRGVPQVVHGDKLKLCHSDVPPSWVPATTTDPVDDTNRRPTANRPSEQPLPVSNQSDAAQQFSDSVRNQRTRPRRRPIDDWLICDEDYDAIRRQRPERTRRLPVRFQDYDM